jgi:hypothetical protein
MAGREVKAAVDDSDAAFVDVFFGHRAIVDAVPVDAAKSATLGARAVPFEEFRLGVGRH